MTTSSQRQYYQALDTEDLVRLSVTDLTESARADLTAELAARGFAGEELAEAQAPFLQTKRAHEARRNEYASRLTRFGGFAIDFFLVAFLQVAAAGFARQIERRPGSTLEGLVVATVFLGYFLFRDAFGGRSIGKRLVGIAVRDRATNAPCSVMQSVVRNALLLLVPIDWLLIFGPRHARLGDMAAKTMVVRSSGRSFPSKARAGGA